MEKVIYCKVDFEGLGVTQKNFYECMIKEGLGTERETIVHIIKDDNPKSVEKYILSENNAYMMKFLIDEDLAGMLAGYSLEGVEKGFTTIDAFSNKLREFIKCWLEVEEQNRGR
ncbi:TPA: hypothetical protein QCR55_000940 [Bacillus cereus]|uniref:hypothetical protein n=1 Tax=unclassified Bacillus (in: firmicutes) TaxID=185979 RepID=UPI00224892EC|nr:hypothetical protein [Bacillus sp. AS_3]MCW4652360.1 hypothetical protein [Bacillus sp. AS_3]MCX2700003.1 hypothetical protein [Bacillus sp. AS_5]HDR4864608.1 hypothetical protein [Bacillus cereus]HDR4877711.1 hypothetical protein [Bacillus cereus]